MFSQNEAQWVASSTAPLQSEFESRRHKRQKEEDGSPEYFTTKKQTPSTWGSSHSSDGSLSDDDDNFAPSERGYGKRSAGNKPYRKNWFQEIVSYYNDHWLNFFLSTEDYRTTDEWWPIEGTLTDNW